MSNRGRGSSGLLVRLAVLILLGGSIAFFLKMRGSPLALTSQQVGRMINSGELVGLSLEDAADKLQHAPPATHTGAVVFDFAHIPGWTAGPVLLEVDDGRVTSATWQSQDQN